MVSREDVKAEILGLIDKYSRSLCPDPGEETPIPDIGIDSIYLMEIIFHIEEKYDIEVDNDALSDIYFVKDVVDVATRYLNPA